MSLSVKSVEYKVLMKGALQTERRPDYFAAALASITWYASQHRIPIVSLTSRYPVDIYCLMKRLDNEQIQPDIPGLVYIDIKVTADVNGWNVRVEVGATDNDTARSVNEELTQLLTDALATGQPPNIVVVQIVPEQLPQ